MKDSVKHLPERTQKELALLQELILKYIPQVRMIILFGSYARGNYVLYDISRDYGIPGEYQSDYDILIISATNNPLQAESKANQVVLPKYYRQLKDIPHPTPPQIIVESTQTINKVLPEARYFYTEIMEEGILLYTDEKYTLPQTEKLSFRQIKEISEEYYNKNIVFAEELLEAGHSFYPKGQYKTGSFIMHQVCERFYKTLALVHTLYGPKTHDLKKLARWVQNYSQQLFDVFPQAKPEDKESYEKLCRAYIQARYNPDFTVSKEQYEYMLSQSETLHTLTRKLCTARLDFYKEQAQEEEK